MRTAKDFSGYLQKIFRPKQLESVFLFVTSRCNSLCRTCFYWDSLNKNQDLTFEQFETISRTAPSFGKLWLSGGEPFMREELAEVIELFYRNNHIHSLNLPTNGLLPKKIDEVIGRVLQTCPKLTIDLNFSIDGLANTHDTIRGVPNNFVKTLQTIDLITAKYKSARRLRRNVATVITREGYREMVGLALHLLNTKDVSGQYFEIIRGNPMDLGLKAINRKELKALHDRLYAIHEAYADKLFADVTSAARWFARMYYLGNVKFHFEVHEQCVERPQKWAMPCTAGVTSAVIDHNGEFRACELRPAVGRLQDHNFNFAAALHSPEMQREVRAIPEANCWCTHSCFIQDSTKFSPRVLLFKIPWTYLKHRWQHLPKLSVDELGQFHEPLPVH